MARRLTAEKIAESLGISRAAVYRLERGEIVKIETLAAVARMLDTSLASLLGVGVEYFDSAVGYFERMRQLEEGSEQILAHFEPVSFLLTTDEYLTDLRRMLVEAAPARDMPAALEEIDCVMQILQQRRRTAAARALSVVSLVGTPEIERFLSIGLVGRFGHDLETLAARRRAAAREVEHVAGLFEREPMGVQLGLVDEVMPHQTFQIFKAKERAVVGVSPFRLGEHPNIHYGVATLTEAAEALKLYTRLFEKAWTKASRGQAAADRLRRLVRTALAQPPLGAAA